MPLLNYTTKVPVNQTIADLQKILAKAKASAIMTEFDSTGQACGMTFRANIGEQDIHFKLPVDVEGVAKALKRDHCYRDMPHAQRVAWRIAKDWVDAQMALIDAGMAELAQVFLPYAQADNGKTLYENLRGNGFLQLSHQKGA